QEPLAEKSCSELPPSPPRPSSSSLAAESRHYASSSSSSSPPPASQWRPLPAPWHKNNTTNNNSSNNNNSNNNNNNHTLSSSPAAHTAPAAHAAHPAYTAHRAQHCEPVAGTSRPLASGTSAVGLQEAFKIEACSPSKLEKQLRSELDALREELAQMEAGQFPPLECPPVQQQQQQHETSLEAAVGMPSVSEEAHVSRSKEKTSSTTPSTIKGHQKYRHQQSPQDPDGQDWGGEPEVRPAAAAATTTTTTTR
ncbi:unnamed protein product, partial [Polarella glacialis]